MYIILSNEKKIIDGETFRRVKGESNDLDVAYIKSLDKDVKIFKEIEIGTNIGKIEHPVNNAIIFYEKQ